MLYVVLIIVSFGACLIGAICGIGGGVIIKPLLDATGIMSVDSLSFLSGCTVWGMAVVSVLKKQRQTGSKINGMFDIKLATSMALGSVVGGLAGKSLYQRVIHNLQDTNRIGAIQAAVLFALTLGALLYTIFREQIKSLNIRSRSFGLFVGAFLGIISSFLGIGGGPINLIALYFFFSMETKQAAQYSLYIIMFSQTASLVSAFVSGQTPEFELFHLILMLTSGVLGGVVGTGFMKRLEDRTVDKLFRMLLVIIIVLCLYNFYKYI